MANPADGDQKDPWAYDSPLNNMEPMSSQPVVTRGVSDSDNNSSVVGGIVKVVMAFIIIGALVFVGKAIVSVIFPAGEDVTDYVNKSEKTIANDLGITFADNAEWVPQIHQWTKDGKVTVHSDDNIGVVYINGKQAGLHIHTNKYKIYNIQIGMGEKEVYEGTTFPFDNTLSILDDMKEGRTTTYYYYNQSNNDCVAVSINDTTNRVVGITYFNNFNQIMETIEW